jgi:hypothetical protein
MTEYILKENDEFLKIDDSPVPIDAQFLKIDGDNVCFGKRALINKEHNEYHSQVYDFETESWVFDECADEYDMKIDLSLI